VTNVPNADQSQDRELTGDVIWTHGAHTVKFGVQANWLQTNFLSSQRSSGIFNFNGQFTGDGFADFLLGYASTESLSTYSRLNFRAPYTQFFTQDDWRIARRLIVNVGMRHELSLPAVEKFNRMANFDMDTNPSSPTMVQAGSEGSDWDARALQNINFLALAPRFGFSYSLPDNRTVIRGGYGIFYSNFITWGGQQSMEVNPPNAQRVSFSSSKTKPQLELQNGFATTALTLANAKNVELISYQRSSVTPTAQQFNLNIQHQFPSNILVEIGYYGNRYDHAWWQFDGNPAPPEAGTVNANRKITSTIVDGSTITLADIVRIRKDGYSNYNSLQLKAEKRYSHELTLLVSYAFAKTIALGDSTTSAYTIQNPNNPAGERGVTLSGGQKQRVALARALVRRPRILVLDDTLARVDAVTAEYILNELNNASWPHTTIFIAHRVSAARCADHIIILDAGRLVESGDHDSLLARGGYYARMMCSQNLACEQEVS
jgi:hypothetical protein